MAPRRGAVQVLRVLIGRTFICLGLVGAMLVTTGCSTPADVVAERSTPIDTGSLAPGSDPPDSQQLPDAPPADDKVEDGLPPEETQPEPSPPEREVPREPRLITGDVTLADLADLGEGKQDWPYDEMVTAVLLDLESWLSEIHPEIHGSPWEPLRGGVFPGYPGRSDIPGCGEPSTDYLDLQQYVAFYCSVGDFLVYDDGPDSLLGSLAAEFGPSIMGVVMAHEYGHVVQQRTGMLARNLATIVLEQQADCFAGAWVGRAASGGSPVVQLSDADVRGALITMVAVRDPVGTSQFDIGGHGTAFDRVGAFQVGFLQGPERCAELIEAPLRLMPNQFQSLADARNDGDLPFGYAEGQIVPLIVDTLNAYWAYQLGALEPSIGRIELPSLRLVPVRSLTEAQCSASTRPVAPGLMLCLADLVVFLDDGVARSLYNDPIVGSADFAVGYLIALGWSEMAQTLLRSPLTGQDRALANDCLAGAYSRDLDPLRPPRIDEGERMGTISPGDLDEAVVAAIQIGDDRFEDQILGSAFEKIDAFRSGVLDGVDVCLARIGG